MTLEILMQHWQNAPVYVWQRATFEDMQLCLEYGKELDERSEYHRHMPLHLAAMFNSDPDVISTLVRDNLHLDAKDSRGNSPLHLAARWNPKVEIIIELLKAKANVLLRNDKERTPLHAAAFGTRNPDVITALLNAQADATLTDANNKTPFDSANGNMMIKDSEAYERLGEASGQLESPN